LLFFIDHYHLPQKILKHFDEILSWSEQIGNYKKTHPHLVKNLDNFYDRLTLSLWDLDYKGPFHLKAPEDYLESRDRVVQEIRENKLSDAQWHWQRLKRTCPLDRSLSQLKREIKERQPPSMLKMILKSPAQSRIQETPKWFFPVLAFILIGLFLAILDYSLNPVEHSYTSWTTPESPVMERLPLQDMPFFAMEATAPLKHWDWNVTVGDISLVSPAEDHSLEVSLFLEEREFHFHGVWEKRDGYLSFLSEEDGNPYFLVLLEMDKLWEGDLSFSATEESRLFYYYIEEEEDRFLFEEFREMSNKKLYICCKTFAGTALDTGIFYLPKE
ncbi:MAG: hypothetical protein PQJ60_15225, partial [Spirochaetales bacterium]|nr:hypothetical protein [Spirochaetales bacterium]